MRRSTKKTVKLTPALLRRMVIQEARKLRKAGLLETLETGVTDPEKVKAEEVDADEYAGTLEKDIDHIKALKIQEQKLEQRLRRIRNAKRAVIKRLA
jgi:hypothetical protein